MKTELLSVILSFAGMIVSAVISALVSRRTAAREIEKMQLTRMREDNVLSDANFSEMVSSVADYQANRGYSSRKQTAALKRVGYIRSFASGELADVLDKLYLAIENGQDVDNLLSDAIKAKRSQKAHC